ncbi:MAG: NarK/NasA family nitrate transporter [Sphingomonadales bacterium]|nr:NarK/NasA family nitrate transporter [Sphingomonadales bacterium]
MENGLVSKAQQNQALGLSTFAFTVCFAVWTIFAIIGIQIKGDLGLTETEFGLLVGTPILTGSLVRVFLGIWTDQYGGRLVFPLTMLASAASTFLLSYADSYLLMLAALGLGIAGGGFAVGVAYVAKWFRRKRGTALGFFGMGNVGAAVTKFVAPFVMVAMGWKTVAQVWAAALAVMAVLFFLFAKDDPDLAARKQSGSKPKSLAEQLEPLKHQQVWRFSVYYFFVFGAFVALALWLPRYLIGVYGVDVKTPACSAPPSRSRPACSAPMAGSFGQIGARRIMYWTFGVSVLCLFMLLSADRLCHPRDQGRHPVLHLDEPGALRDDGVRAGLLHVAGQGGGLQAHPGLLPGSCRLGRRAGRPGGRPGRLHPADRVRRAQRPHRHLDELLHGCCSHWSRSLCLDASGDPADGTEARGVDARSLPHFRKWPSCTSTKAAGRDAGDRRLAPGRPGVLATQGAASRGATSGSRSPPAACLLGLDGLVDGRRETAAGRLPTSPPTSSSGWRPCRGFRAPPCGYSTASWCRSSAGGCGPPCPPHHC